MADESGSAYGPDIEGAIAEAIGEPGQRRFRIIATAGGQTTIMWMEKQQLDALARAIDQILLKIGEEFQQSETTNAPALDFDLKTRQQFRVGKLEIGFDQERDRLLIIGYDIESADEAGPSLAAYLTRDLARQLSAEAAAVVAAGRPRCVLCGLPMGPGPHACAHQNGHLASYG